MRQSGKPSPAVLFKRFGDSDAYRVAMLEHGHTEPVEPAFRKLPGKQISTCGLTHESDWSEWRRYERAGGYEFEGRWCCKCAQTQVREVNPGAFDPEQMFDPTQDRPE